MEKADLSRRRFTLLVGTLPASQISPQGAGTRTAQEVVRHIQTSLGGEWPPEGPDGFRAGDPNTPVTGIATTAMATLDVLKRALKTRANLIITYEPTFFSRQDAPVPGDPVYQAKKEFIEKNRLVAFRLRDHWHARKENDMLTGLAEALGWTKYRVQPDDVLYEIPAISAQDAVALIRKKLNLRGGLRAVGDRNAQVRRVLLYPGVMTTATMWQRYGETDLMIAGEVREWENTHYAADIHTIGEKRALVTIGRVASEDPGMRACAEWLKTVVPDIPARWIAAGDLYWRAA
ncbi:MAG TPA: Nif3-like dinuclear metal center hexameric protein [Bryobacteraceae bacterium]